jgi:cysteine desulfurase
VKTAIYLDHAATTPLDVDVAKAMAPYQSEHFANPSSLYGAARVTKKALEDARAKVANILGARVTEIVWTSGGTESVNLAIQGVLRAHPGASWVTTAIEHDAVLSCREPLERVGHRVTTVGVKPTGLVDVDSVIEAVGDSTVLVSVMLANNEIGTIQPIADISKKLQIIRKDRLKRGVTLPLYLHTDACQAAGYLDLSVTRLGVDLLSLNGSKIYGPRGSALLYIKYGTKLEPLIYGGGQERGRRSGTENVAAIVGLAVALELAQKQRGAEGKRLAALRDDLLKKIEASLPSSILNGEMKHRLPGNLNLTFPGLDGQALVLYLDQAGILASTGSACSSGDAEPSHVLLAIGRSEAEAAASLRLTLGRETTQEQIDYVVEKLPPIVERLVTIDQ